MQRGNSDLGFSKCISYHNLFSSLLSLQYFPFPDWVTNHWTKGLSYLLSLAGFASPSPYNIVIVRRLSSKMTGIWSLSSTNLWQGGGKGGLILLTCKSRGVKPLSYFYSDIKLHTLLRCIKLGKRQKMNGVYVLFGILHIISWLLKSACTYFMHLNLQYLSDRS